MMRALKILQKQEKENFSIPRNVQQVIPIQKIWTDGIFLVGKNKYSYTYKFKDINYAVASKEDKENMFLDYSELINSFDSGATTKLTIVLRRINRKDFEQEILLKFRNNGQDTYREEYNRVLMGKALDSSSMVRELYITISVFKRSYEEAKNYFRRIGNEIIAHLSKLGSKCVELDAVERLRILHDFYRIGEEANYNLDIKRLMQRGHSFKDYICPDSFSFRSDYFEMGNKFGRVFFLKEYASFIKDSFIAELTDMSQNMMMSIDIIPIPTDEAVREVENRLLGVETNITNWVRKQNANNNFNAMIPYDMQQQRGETKEFLDDLTTRDQRMMVANVTLVITADSKEQLEAETDDIFLIAGKHVCQIATLKYQQMNGLNTALPIGVRKINNLRTLTTESLAILNPFKVQEIFDKGGIYYGENAISRDLIMINKENLLNQSAIFFGVPGSGKSFFAKLQILFLSLSTDDDILICDPERRVFCIS